MVIFEISDDICTLTKNSIFEKDKINIISHQNHFHQAYIYASRLTLNVKLTQSESINPLSIKTLYSYTHERANSVKSIILFFIFLETYVSSVFEVLFLFHNIS